MLFHHFRKQQESCLEAQECPFGRIIPACVFFLYYFLCEPVRPSDRCTAHLSCKKNTCALLDSYCFVIAFFVVFPVLSSVSTAGRFCVLGRGWCFPSFSRRFVFKCCRWCSSSTNSLPKGTPSVDAAGPVLFPCPSVLAFFVSSLVRACSSVWDGSGGRLSSCEGNVM